jgi:type IX secretion system PorP/SprF family membrane protein
MIHNHTFELTMRKNLLNLLVLVCLSCSSFAQDIHLSQIHASPTILNPAMTGLTNADVRFTLNTKSQWNTVTKAYKTLSASADMKLKFMPNGDVIGGGLGISSDKAGDLEFKTNSIGLSFSYMKALDKRGNFVSFGIQNARVSNSVNYSNIIAFDLEPSIQEGAPDKISYWDVSAGVGWFYAFNKDYAFHLGASLYHINRPYVSFFDDGTNTDDLFLFRKWTFHGTGDLKLSQKSILKPSFIYYDQGPHKEITMGTFWKYRPSKDRGQDNPTAIYFGAWVRWFAAKRYIGKDAIIGAVRLDYKNTFMTFTFDVNISSLSKVSFGAGGPEFSIIQMVDFRDANDRPTKVECPAFFY